MSRTRPFSRWRRPGRALAAATGAALLLCATSTAAHAQDPTSGSDFTIDGHEDIPARTADGRLVFHPHSGTFDPADPGATYTGTITIDEDWAEADWLASVNTGWPGGDILVENDGFIALHQHSRVWNPDDPLSTLAPDPTRVGGAGWDSFEEKFTGSFVGRNGPSIVGRDSADGHLYAFPSTLNRDGSLTIGEKQLLGRDFRGYDQFASADLNGDEVTDFVARSGSVLYGFLMMPTPAGAEASTNIVRISDGWEQADTTLTKDVDSDGKKDLVSRIAATGELVAFLNVGENGAVAFSGRHSLGYEWAQENPIF
ncbi:hypothetical protein CFN78_05980 [Amycolatopsis antarctica]|uniref:Alpha integrin n=1 Tax=Amycolatopsis antarctica TaxID=1854586 RepID=A0A263D5W6_9PSEU|nr:hypothetical protein [Amycolatopsis antarctica]OZM73850.1 hypothetical protein CFN78_05980 [Amycolatopsis antarctica]